MQFAITHRSHTLSALIEILYMVRSERSYLSSDAVSPAPTFRRVRAKAVMQVPQAFWAPVTISCDVARVIAT